MFVYIFFKIELFDTWSHGCKSHEGQVLLSHESCSTPLNNEKFQGLLCPPTESIDDDMTEAF